MIEEMNALLDLGMPDLVYELLPKEYIKLLSSFTKVQHSYGSSKVYYYVNIYDFLNKGYSRSSFIDTLHELKGKHLIYVDLSMISSGMDATFLVAFDLGSFHNFIYREETLKEINLI